MKIAIVVDGRFPGGTSSAVASEIDALAPHLDLRVIHLGTKMFRGDQLNQKLVDACARNGVEIERTNRIAADVIVFHNLASLKFGLDPRYRFYANQIVVVTHENFTLPSGQEAFDVAGSIDLLRRRSFTGGYLFAPVSEYNRSTVRAWLDLHGAGAGVVDLPLADRCWFNICSFERVAPTLRPRDRRGRLSRPGPEKFPSRQTMLDTFSSRAESCTILGMHHWTGDKPKNWTVHPFNGVPLDVFFDQIDFFVYYTSSNWMESFGRVIVEAIMAGKLVIADPRLEPTFGEAIISADPEDVDMIVESYCGNPGDYSKKAAAAQEIVHRFSAQAFVAQWSNLLGIEAHDGNKEALGAGPVLLRRQTSPAAGNHHARARAL